MRNLVSRLLGVRGFGLQTLKNQKGFTILELVLVLVIAGGLFGGALYVYGRLQTSSWIQQKSEQIVHLTAMLDNVKALRGGSLPAQATAIALNDTNSPFKNYIGTDTSDLEMFQYACPAGNPGTVTITVRGLNLPSTTALAGLHAVVTQRLTAPKFTIGAIDINNNLFTITTTVPSCV